MFDPNGTDVWDALKGTGDAILNNMFGVDLSQFGNISSANDYGMGRLIGNITSGFIGISEILGGGFGVATGSALTVTTLGTTSPLSIPLTGVSAIIVGHGIYTLQNSASNLNSGTSSSNYSDPKFGKQLENQFKKDGPNSILKSLRSLRKRVEKHKKRLPNLKYKSSVEREIRTWEKQIETTEQFIKEKGIKNEVR